MGVLIYPPTQESNQKKMHITNWRTVGILEDGRVDVVIAGCERYLLEMTIDQFWSANHQSTPILNEFQYVNSTLSCPECEGRGKVDWVQKVRSKNNHVYSHRSVSYYRRNKKVRNKITPILSLIPMTIMYGSEPNLLPGQEICPTCKGTGLYIIRNERILERISDA